MHIKIEGNQIFKTRSAYCAYTFKEIFASLLYLPTGAVEESGKLSTGNQGIGINCNAFATVAKVGHSIIHLRGRHDVEGRGKT